MLRIFHNRCVRSVFRVTATECYNFRISNEELVTRLNLRKIDDYITKRQLRWSCCQNGLPSTFGENVVFVGMYGRFLYKSLTKAGVDVKNGYALALDKSK